ncbi:MAG: PqqD family protein [Clostridia bacterium]|nr:PqqD family protein [Clostridia bacterium]
MKIKKGFVVRNVGGECVVVPVGAMSKTFHGMINLNETGNFLWEFFSADHTVEEGVAALCAEYDVEESVARNDVQRFADILLQNGFAEE